MNYLSTNGHSLFWENHAKGSSGGALSSLKFGWKHTNEPFPHSAASWAMTEQAQAREDQFLWALKSSSAATVSSMYIPDFLT